VRVDEIDPAIRRLRAAAERVGANLVEIERDPTRQMLDAASLRGETAVRWIAARDALAYLFDGHVRVDALVEWILSVRGTFASPEPRRVSELESLLVGPAIELTTDRVAIADRGLLDASTKVVRCTADELIARMTESFEVVKATVVAVGRVWDEAVPRIGATRTVLAAAVTRAAGLGDEWNGELEAARRSLEQLGDALAGDPLSVLPAAVDRVERTIASIAREVEAAGRLRDELSDRIDAAKLLVDELADAMQTCRRTQRDVSEKIATSPRPDPMAEVPDLARELEGIVARTQTQQWRTAEREFEAWNAAVHAARARVDRLESDARATLAQRDELRGRLDAYGAKAAGVGRVEDPQLSRLFDAARAALFTAPTDLERADALVRRYQDAVTAPARKESM